MLKKMSHITARLFVILCLVNRFISAEIPSVNTPLGKITGETRKAIFQGKQYEVNRYLGIPYAKPPIGELRFKRPVPHGPFSGTFTATKMGPACPQYFMPDLPAQPKENTSEDCLFLNIFVPRQEPDKKSGHAVMFFIHGGGFTMCSATFVDAGVISSVGNVIVVTFNYRLGLLGFLDLDNHKASGNFGLFDQRLALQWVNENIHAFGGDKDRVALFGASAGAISVSLQMLYPANEGLFRGGIAESGALSLPGLYEQNSFDVAKYFAANMSCNVENMDEVFNCLKSATHERIIQVVADAIISGGVAGSMTVRTLPTLDGELIKTSPVELFKNAQTQTSKEINFFRSLKLINGVNGNEGILFLMMFSSIDWDELEISREQMNTQQIPGAMAMAFGPRAAPDVVKQLLIAEYTDWKNPDNPKRLREELLRLFGDIYFNVPAIQMSQVHSNASNVDSYFYNFLAVLEKRILPVPKWVNTSNHGDELGPVFGYNFDLKTILNLTDYIPPDWELEMSKRMMTYWTNFAKSGDPNQPASGATSSVVWPKYEITSQSYIKIDKEDSIGQYLFARETEFWRILRAVFDATEYAETIASQFGKKDQQTCEKDGTCG